MRVRFPDWRSLLEAARGFGGKRGIRGKAPVRWWRDDADRYVTRGPQLVPAAKFDPALRWAFDLIARPVDPGLQRLLDTRLAVAAAIPAELLYNGPGNMSGTGVAINEYRARLGLPPL